MHRRPRAVVKFATGLWRYLRGTLRYSLVYIAEGCCGDVKFQSDASFAPEGSRSRSGGVITYAGSVMQWISCRQTVTAWSVCEAEADAMAHVLSVGILIMYTMRNLLHLPMKGTLTENNSADTILLKREHLNFGKWRTMAFALRCSWVRDQLHYDEVELMHTPGKVLIADMLTKILQRTRLQQLKRLAEIIDPS